MLGVEAVRRLLIVHRDVLWDCLQRRGVFGDRWVGCDTSCGCALLT